ncbi:MAG: hypothetical protein AAGB11_00290 [Pseudomonadota bacterium]
MIRLAATVALALFALHGASALAETPIPTPNPLRGAGTTPQAALAKLVNADASAAPTLSAYAPASDTGTLSAPSNKESTLYVVGKLAEDSEPIGDGLEWRVYSDYPDASGQLPMMHRGRGGDLELRLPEGRYIVHVAYGRAALSRVVDVQGASTSDTFVLNAGGLQLNAVLDDDETSRGSEATFELYMLEGENRRAIGNIKSGAIARLPAGSYHIVSRYGDVNAVRRADVMIEPGKLTRVSLRHKAGSVSLKLVRTAGGEAIANTEWTVYDAEGEPVFERIGAHANITLAAGEYEVTARHRGGEFTRKFTVNSGDDEDVIVIAQRYSAPL